MSGFDERLADGGPGVWHYLGRWPIAEVPPDLQEAVDAVWAAVGQDLRKLLRAVSNFAGPFRIDHLADHLGHAPRVISRRLMLLEATLAAAECRFPQAGPFLEHTVDQDGRARRLMPNPVREAVICKVLADEQD